MVDVTVITIIYVGQTISSVSDIRSAAIALNQN